MAITKQEQKMRGLELSVDTIVDMLSNTDSFILEEILERLVEADPGTAYVIQHILNNLEKEMA